MMAGLMLLVLAVPPSAAASPQPAPCWPAPRDFTLGGENRTLSSSFSFSFTRDGATATPPATLAEAFTRYRALTLPHRASPSPAAPPLLLGLVVSVGSEDEAPPQLGTNESYQLNVGAAGLATLTAQTIYGALRGLETFSQVVGFDFESSVYRVTGVPLTISDAPRFPHRGFMVDTSRHYQPLGMLKRLLDSMAYAKLNTLHWHAVDDQSFPLTVAAFPRLQGLGAYSAQERYTRLDVRRCPSAHSLAHQPRIPCSALLIACRALIDRSLTSSNTPDCEAFACCSRWIPRLTPAAGAAATQRSAHPAHARTGRHGRHSTHPSTPPST